MCYHKPSKIKAYTLDIHTTHSTWLELMELMSCIYSKNFSTRE